MKKAAKTDQSRIVICDIVGPWWHINYMDGEARFVDVKAYGNATHEKYRLILERLPAKGAKR